ncbi:MULTISPECIES: hypothetical protein [Actinosynnema]|uniref:hypothetical protein n=1 Tax=Actinosynnema TaxID=40566 RepID=UPI0020A5AB1C|nr:hypothetical protein [Actinosynnema pretiosum]MCP2099253.1 hypothetical protein [Actinosynnema pretiosum]
MYLDETAGGGGTAVGPVASAAGATAGALSLGLSGFQAALTAVSRANEAKELALDPDAVNKMITRLKDMQDSLDKLDRRSDRLVYKMPLGGGYADEISALNQQVGLQAVDSLPKFNKAITELIEQLERSRASYRAIDEGTANAMNRTLSR